MEVRTDFLQLQIKNNLIIYNFLGWFGDFLSWKGFELFTKISYSVYLVQFPVFFYNVGMTKHVGEFKPRMLVILLLLFFIKGIFLLIFVLDGYTGNTYDSEYFPNFDFICRDAFSESKKSFLRKRYIST